jgi:membrane-associated protease RseP (regulator of RpoE activity)
MGAFIRIRSPISSRAALFDIGVAGPIAGFVLALPALAVGLALSQISPSIAQASDLQLGYPAAFHLLEFFIPGRGSLSSNVILHPVAIAAWVGLFATALNLLPGGQLDGGHILYALSPRAHKISSRALWFALLLMSPFLWLGWLLWAVVLVSFGRHPYIPLAAPLGRARTALALAAFVIFLLSFTPVPFAGAALDWHSTLETFHSLLQRLQH